MITSGKERTESRVRLRVEAEFFVNIQIEIIVAENTLIGNNRERVRLW